MKEPANGVAPAQPVGCDIAVLHGADCNRYVAWVLGEQGGAYVEPDSSAPHSVAPGGQSDVFVESSNKPQPEGSTLEVAGAQPALAPEGADGLVWCLAHCDDGVTWGRYDAQTQRWILGSQAEPAVSPLIRHDSLQELRIFGCPGEVLIWRAGAELGVRRSGVARRGFAY